MQTFVDATLADTPVLLLVIDDDADSLARLSLDLTDTGLEILTTSSTAIGLDIAWRRSPQIVLMTPQPGALAALEGIVELDSHVHVIRLDRHYSGEEEDNASGLLKLRERIARLAREIRRQRSRRPDDESRPNARFGGIVGRSPLMWAVFTRIRHIAPHYGMVLITGEPGVGKELAARALHRLSPVSEGLFVALSCPAMTEDLLGSELFEQEKCTLFFDEIGELPLTAQAKLLRMLEKAPKTDVRVIAATKHDLRASVTPKRFLGDLYRRLSTVEIQLPRLAERKEDLPLLEQHFIARFAAKYSKEISGLTHDAHIRLARHSWPGNVRELENVIGYAVAAFSAGTTAGTQQGMIDIQDLPAYLQKDAGYRKIA